MNRDDRLQKRLERLEAARLQANNRMAEAQKRMDAKFDRMRRHIASQEHNSTSTKERIIAAALDLLDEDGLNGLSLRKLAGELDMQAPALYWYFKSKEELIDHMAEAILRAKFQDLKPRLDAEAWQDWLVEACRRLREAMRTHRDGARVVAGAHLFPAVTLVKLFEIAMESLTSAGVEMQRANLIITTCVHFVFGNVIEEQASPSLEQIKQFDLTKLAADYPIFAKSVQQSIQAASAGYDEFEDSLRLIIGSA